MLRFRRHLLLLLVSTASVWSLTAGQLARAEEMLDGLAAVVNNHPITISQVWELVGAKRRAAREQLKGKELEEKLIQLQSEAVNELIDRKLTLDYFKEKGFQLPSYMIDDRIATVIREEHQGDRSAFARKLSSFGYTIERFRKEEMDKIIVAAMRNQAVKTNPIIEIDRLKKFYQEHIKDFSLPEKVHLRMIILRSSERGTAEQREQFLSEIAAKVSEGSSFSDLAKLYSEDDTSEKGGDWGWIESDTLSEAISKVAFSLKAGKTSKPINIGGTSYLLYCEERQAKTVQTFEESRDVIEKVLQGRDREDAYKAWIEKLRKKAYIKVF
jgi:peptidyl-prolyl cis-trans isomerase SurA